VCALAQIYTFACMYSKPTVLFHSNYISNISFEESVRNMFVLLKAAFVSSVFSCSEYCIPKYTFLKCFSSD
jgi:hypothetical protein